MCRGDLQEFKFSAKAVDKELEAKAKARSVQIRFLAPCCGLCSFVDSAAQCARG